MHASCMLNLWDETLFWLETGGDNEVSLGQNELTSTHILHSTGLLDTIHTISVLILVQA